MGMAHRKAITAYSHQCRLLPQQPSYVEALRRRRRRRRRRRIQLLTFNI
jgi:hypothetical protein